MAAGGSRQVLEFAKALALRGHEITMVAPESHRNEPGFAVPPQIHLHMVPVVRRAGMRPVSFLLNSIRILKTLLWTRRPDLLLWFDSPGQMAPLWALRSASCPIVYFVNGLPAEEVQGLWRLAPLLNLLTYGLRLGSRKAKAIVSVCPEVLGGLRCVEPVDSQKCFVIRNGVDPDRFFPQPHERARQEVHLQGPGPYIGFVGGFFPWHGLDTLVDAMTVVAKSFPTVQCLLVGDGQTKAALEEQVHRLQLSHHVRFIGRVVFDAVPQWIAACDVCVVLHRQIRSYPGDSMKLWEYLACGRPVVATAGPGYGDTVSELHCGLPTTADDPDDLARQLVTLLDSHHLRRSMGERGRVAVMRSHTWSARAAQLERVCHQAVAETALAA